MSRPFRASVAATLLTHLIAGACTLLAGCGQKGPLMLPAPAKAASAAQVVTP